MLRLFVFQVLWKSLKSQFAAMGPCCTVCALLALYLLMSFLVHFSKVQVLDAGAASIEMQQRHQNEEMPEDIRGILWMRLGCLVVSLSAVFLGFGPPHPQLNPKP